MIYRRDFNCLAFGLGLTGLCALTSAGAQASTHSEKPILVLGDSLSAEYGLTRGTGWVNLMDKQAKQSKWDLTIVNASISGDTTAGGLSRLPALLTLHSPQLVILELGGNDALRGLPLPQTQRNLLVMVKASQKAGAKTLILGIQVPPNYGADYADKMKVMFEQVARQTGSGLLPFFLQGVADDADPLRWFQSDRIYPNEAAQALMMRNVWPKVQQLLPLAMKKPA